MLSRAPWQPYLHQTAAFTLGTHKQPCWNTGDLGRIHRLDTDKTWHSEWKWILNLALFCTKYLYKGHCRSEVSIAQSLHHLHLQWQRQTAAQNKHQALIMVKNAFNLEWSPPWQNPATNPQRVPLTSGLNFCFYHHWSKSSLRTQLTWTAL